MHTHSICTLSNQAIERNDLGSFDNIYNEQACMPPPLSLSLSLSHKDTTLSKTRERRNPLSLSLYEENRGSPHKWEHTLSLTQKLQTLKFTVSN